ncbi:MAG TPA: Maf family protein [Tepidiformaceae bacterium]|nr:Maf family protein [Tepidiformaceae bacterium]
MTPRVILASASPRRRELLRALFDEFEVVPSEIDEPFGHDPVADAESLALAKAREVARANSGVVVIGADTIVFDELRAYAKPADEADALAIWRALRGRVHRVVTGIAVVGRGFERTGHAISEVELANLDDAAVRAYIASGRPMDKAGAYAIQDTEVGTVARLEGCYCNVVGLPLWRLRELLMSAGAACAEPAARRPGCASCPDAQLPGGAPAGHHS